MDRSIQGSLAPVECGSCVGVRLAPGGEAFIPGMLNLSLYITHYPAKNICVMQDNQGVPAPPRSPSFAPQGHASMELDTFPAISRAFVRVALRGMA
jgi:hypothetical protein